MTQLLPVCTNERQPLRRAPSTAYSARKHPHTQKPSAYRLEALSRNALLSSTTSSLAWLCRQGRQLSPRNFCPLWFSSSFPLRRGPIYHHLSTRVSHGVYARGGGTDSHLSLSLCVLQFAITLLCYHSSTTASANYYFFFFLLFPPHLGTTFRYHRQYLKILILSKRY